MTRPPKTGSLTPRAAAKRQQMLSAARTLFLSEGYARTSTDAVTKAAGVSKETLYSYFGDKAGLLSAVVMAELEGLNLTSKDHQPVSSLSEFCKQLVDFAEQLTTYFQQPDAVALLRLLAGEAMHVPELRPVVREAAPARVMTLVRTLLEDAQAGGLIELSDPDLSVRMLAGPLLTYVVVDGVYSEGQIEPPSRATVERLIDLFLLTVKTE